MLSILLGILKIIGIIIGSVLLLLLVIVLSMLFVPVRYVIKGEKRNGSEAEEIVETLNGSGRITWFLHFISIKVQYDKEMNIILKILGIPIYNHLKKMNKPVKEKKKSKKNKKKRNPKNKVKKVDVEEVSVVPDEECSVEEVPLKTNKKQNNGNRDDLNQNDIKGTDTKEDKSVKKNKCRHFIRVIVEKIKNIKYTIRNLYDKMVNVHELISYYSELMEREETKNAFALCKKQISKFFKHIRPKKVRGRVSFGFNDPGTTGQIFGYICMLYPIYGNSIVVIPDFENEILEGNVLIKGRIRLFVLVSIALKVMFNKNLKHFISLVKREDM